MFGKKRTKPAGKPSDLTAFIDEGSEIEGKYTFTGTVMLNGRFRGEIVSNDTLIVGEKGVVNAAIRAGIVLINGEVVGNVLRSERVEIRGTARVFGDVAPRLSKPVAPPWGTRSSRRPSTTLKAWTLPASAWARAT